MRWRWKLATRMPRQCCGEKSLLLRLLAVVSLPQVLECFLRCRVAFRPIRRAAGASSSSRSWIYVARFPPRAAKQVVIAIHRLRLLSVEMRAIAGERDRAGLINRSLWSRLSRRNGTCGDLATNLAVHRIGE